MGPWEKRAVQSVLVGMFPSGEEGVPGAGEVDLLPDFERFVKGIGSPRGPAVRAAFVASALFLPLVLAGRPRTIMGLEQPAREACLERLIGHRWYWPRQAGLMLKATASLVYFQHPRVRQAFGLPPIAAADGE